MNQSQFQKAAGISAGLAARWFPHITAAMKEFGITAPLDQAMFIAQMCMGASGAKRISVIRLPVMAGNIVVAV